jgi:hypothetical protein
LHASEIANVGGLFQDNAPIHARQMGLERCVRRSIHNGSAKIVSFERKGSV